MKRKAALITGASDRIGKSIAMTLAQMGYEIALHYNHSEQKTKKLLKQMHKRGYVCKSFQADFSEDREVERLFEKATSEMGIELIVNNASDFKKSFIDEPGTDLLNHMMQVNFTAPYLLTKLFAQRKKKGAIINLLDTNIKDNHTSHLDYLLSKKTLQAFTMYSAKSLAPKGIRVNAIAPGLILPPANETMDYLKKRAKDIPLQKHGDVSGICEAIRFLVASDFVTGQILFIDGGEHL